MAKTKRNHVNKSRKHQKKYKMKGSSKHRKTHKKHFFSKKYSCNMCHGNCKKSCECACHTKSMKGGCGCSGSQLGGDATKLSLAYTGQPSQSYPNPYLAYTEKGGNADISKAYPNVNGATGSALNIINPGQTFRGGENFSPSDVNTSGYPNGLIGPSWTSSPATWPGVGNVDNITNHYDKNIYQPTDVSRQMIASGSAPPFSVGGKKYKRKQRGGNIIPDNLLNLGNMFKYGTGSVYNSLNGYQQPTNPLPWNDQLKNTTNLSAIKY